MPHLPRLKNLGVDILWLMPVHPIGILNRKGTLGSYYAVRDYLGVNAEFGNKDDFRKLVERIHDLGMYVIIDWVANHSAADNPLVTDHPEWYSKTVQGQFQPTPWVDWDDVLDFDYEQPGLRKYMTEAMKYWVQEFHIDGFRADVAGFVPLEFWENIREELERIRPVFMLAEWETRDLHRRAFDMTYAWSLWDSLREATTGKKGAAPLVEYIAHDVNTFPPGAFRMTFTDNHDKNSWNGTPFTNFGKGLQVITTTIKGMPMIYSGQEAGLDRSLAFFEKDQIEWKEHPNASFFKTMFALKKSNQALWNGHWGSEMTRLASNCMNEVISFVREKNGDRIIVLINFSDNPLNITLKLTHYPGKYEDVFSKEVRILDESPVISLKAWGFAIFESP